MSSSSDGIMMGEIRREKVNLRCIPRNWLLGLTTFFLYGISIWILLKFVHIAVSNDGLFSFLSRQDLLTTVETELDCDGAIAGNTSVIQRLSVWKFNSTEIQDKLLHAKNKCREIKRLFLFQSKSMSQEETEFPLSYGLLVYKQVTQVLFMLSSFYHPQNEYCIAVSGSASDEFKEIIGHLPKCFSNVHVMMRPKISWGSFEIINSTFGCLEYLSRQKSNWTYFQYLSGVDVPLKTNLEMVRILKALDGNSNVEVKEYQHERLAGKNISDSPLPLFKSSLSAVISRPAADYITSSIITKQLLKFLKGTKVPDESFWGTLMGNIKKFPVPGGFDGQELINTKHMIKFEETHEKEHDVGWSSYISRRQIWQSGRCGGKWSSGSCVFGVKDLSWLLRQPPLVAHKFYIDYQPAGYFCTLSAIRKRSLAPVAFNATLYSQLPQYELFKGASMENLSHPSWL